jgi:hypothetical protein
MIFTNFSDSDVVLGRTNKVSSGFWSDGNYAHSQSMFFTSSTQTQWTGSNGINDVKNGVYYYNVYNANPSTDVTAQVHFSIAYGNFYGSGSGYVTTGSLLNPSKAIYTQYKNYLLNPSDSVFNFKSGSYQSVGGIITDTTLSVTGSSIFTIAFSTTKFKDRVDEGQLEFSLSGSNGLFTFIDDSTVVNKQQDVYNIISGSVINGIPNVYYSGSAIQYGAIGLFYPKTGVVVLNADVVPTTVGFSVDTTMLYPYAANQQYLLQALQLAAANSMKVRKSEFLPSRQYFVRIKNLDYNYSNNPTYVSDGTDGNTKGTIKISEFLTDPKTYVTTVGLYDDSNELLAVAKLSSPFQKSFDNELLIKIRVDF